MRLPRDPYILLSAGLLTEVLGALLYLRTTSFAAGVLMVGGLLIAIAYLVVSASTREGTVRRKRLDRMGLLGGLCYLVAGGFAQDGQRGVWILLFVIATILTVYSIFVKDNIERKS